jgi:serine/threonine protein kinase
LQRSYFVLELCEATLGQYIGGKFKIKLPSSTDCLRQMTQGLKYIHSVQLVHRDVKPDNVLISTNPQLCLKISDFGLSKSITASGSFSMSGMKGSINFMAPEILNFGDHENRRSRDVRQRRVLTRLRLLRLSDRRNASVW